MPNRAAHLFVLALTVPIFAGCWKEIGLRPQADLKGVEWKQDPVAEKLIDKLQNFGESSAGIHETAWASQFMAIDEEPRFGGGILGSAKPTVNPTMRSLVQMGVRALPSLFEHLSDARATKKTVTHERGFGAMWYADEYDSRYADPGRQPSFVNKKGIGGLSDNITNHTITVGDLCYVAIGQIVNRGLATLRYQPTACQVINSPTQTPALARAVREEWRGLTPAGHCAQLEDDSYSLWPFAAPEAVKRLLYYYPKEGERVALKLLGRKFYDQGKIWDYGEKIMMKADSPSKWRQQYAEAIRKFGEDEADMLPHWIHWSHWETSTDHQKADQDRAKRMLESTFPSYSPYKNEFHNVVPLDDQAELISGLQGFQNKRIDTAVHIVFLQAQKLKLIDEQDRYKLDELVMACADRLAGKGHDREYADFFCRRIREIESTPKDSTERYRLESMRKCLGRVQKK